MAVADFDRLWAVPAMAVAAGRAVSTGMGLTLDKSIAPVDDEARSVWLGCSGGGPGKPSGNRSPGSGVGLDGGSRIAVPWEILCC